MAWKFPRLRRVRRFGADRKGATAVEFALVAVPFFGLMGMTIETGLGFIAGQALDSAATNAGRSIMVGTLAKANSTPAAQEAAFKDQLCKNAGWFIPCSKIYYDIQSYTTFDAATLGVPTKDGALDTSVLPRFNPGIAGSIVVVRAYYQRKVYADFVGGNLGWMPGGYQLIVGTSVFRSEG